FEAVFHHQGSCFLNQCRVGDGRLHIVVNCCEYFSIAVDADIKSDTTIFSGNRPYDFSVDDTAGNNAVTFQAITGASITFHGCAILVAENGTSRASAISIRDITGAMTSG